MIRITIAAAAALLQAEASAPFASVLEDVPLPPGFVETTAPVWFDGRGGRVALVTAAGDAAPARVAAFYAAALPALGWVEAGQGGLTFVRGGERLEVAIAAGPAGGAQLRLRLIAASSKLALE